MLTEEEKRTLKTEFADKRKGMSAIKDEIKTIGDEKEVWFKKRQEIQRQISKLIKQVVDLRNERNSLTESVHSQKGKRAELNTSINEEIVKIKDISPEQKAETSQNTPISYSTGHSYGSDRRSTFVSRDNPAKIKKEIDKLEYSIETEGFSFKKEQEVMKKIKELKKVYNQIKDALGSKTEAKKISKSINGLKSSANKLHKDIQEKAVLSQEKHEEMITISKQIDELKAELKVASDSFTELKKKYNKATKEIKKTGKSLDKIREQLGEEIKVNAARARKDEEKLMKAKEQAVEEKIKKKIKLTTADLLVFQKGN